MPQLRDFVERVLEDGQGSTVKLTCRTKNGTFLAIEMSLIARESDGGHILALLQDLSEHRKRGPED
jgi:hypothetical protein